MSADAAHQPSLPDEPVLPAREPLDDLLDHIGDYAVLNGQLDGRHLRAYLALCGYAIMPAVNVEGGRATDSGAVGSTGRPTVAGVSAETMTAWIKWQQTLLWSDLDYNLRSAINGVWSMAASDTARSIVQAARLVGAAPHGAVPYPLVAGGVYEAILRAGGVEPDLPADEAEWQRLDTLMSKYGTTRATCVPRHAATLAEINSERERTFIAEEFDLRDGDW